MNLDELRRLSNNSNSALKDEVFACCSPKAIADEIMTGLKKGASENAKRGERRAVRCYTIWCKSNSRSVVAISDGIFADINFKNGSKDLASKILFDMVEGIIKSDKSNDEVKLEFEAYTREFGSGAEITASLEW